MKTSDFDLACAAANGDGVAFSTLLERHYDRIFRTSVSILGSRADAEDLTHEVCVALPRKIRGFEGRAAFSTWLYRVIVNAARDHMRKRATYKRAVEDWGELQLLQAPDDDADDIAWLNAAMGTLAPNLRETVALVLGEELNHAQAASVLGVSEGTVSWRMSQVRKHLSHRAQEEGLK